MGSSYSRRSRNASEKSEKTKIGSSTKSPRKDLSNDITTSEGEKTCDVETRSDKIVHERKDSKKFWVSHVKFRRSNSDLRRPSSERKAEICNVSKAALAKQTHQNAQNSKSLLLASVSLHSPEEKKSKGNVFCEGASANNVNIKGVNGEITELSANCGEHSAVSNDSKSGSKYRSVNAVELYNILNDGALSPCICNPTYILLLDTRSEDCYEEDHVWMAKPSSSLYSDIQYYNDMHGFSTSTISNTINEYTWIIVYGDPIDLCGDGIEERSEIKSYRELEGNFNVEPYILTVGFKSFRNYFPFLCTKQQLPSKQVYPSMILDHQLYQGRGDQATNSKVVEDLKITHIVNITQEHKNAFPDKVEYFTLKLDDVPQTQLLKHFENTSAFLANAFSSGGRALVHCNLGVSRSSSVSIAYLIKSRHWTLKKAYDYIKERRTCIRPNRGFLQQLSAWEERILGKKYTDADEIWF